MRLRAYIARRLILLIPQLVGVTSIVFFLMRVLPGDPVNLIVGPLADEQTIETVTRSLGLDQPLHVQYMRYMRDLVDLDLGDSWVTGNPVVQDLWMRVPATFELITLSTLLGLFIGIALGMVAAVSRRTVWDHIIRVVSVAGISVPNFWLALILIFILSFIFGWLPAPLGRIAVGVDPPRDITGLWILDSVLTFNVTALRSTLSHIALPVLSMSAIIMAPVVRITRVAMIEATASDYVTYARACGLSRARTQAYALRGALPPIVTIIGVLYSRLLGGAVLIEAVFGWPGVAKYAVDSMLHTDYAPVQGFIMVAAVWTVLVYLVVDLLYVAVDPRITHN